MPCQVTKGQHWAGKLSRKNQESGILGSDSDSDSKSYRFIIRFRLYNNLIVSDSYFRVSCKVKSECFACSSQQCARCSNMVKRSSWKPWVFLYGRWQSAVVGFQLSTGTAAMAKSSNPMDEFLGLKHESDVSESDINQLWIWSNLGLTVGILSCELLHFAQAHEPTSQEEGQIQIQAAFCSGQEASGQDYEGQTKTWVFCLQVLSKFEFEIWIWFN